MDGIRDHGTCNSAKYRKLTTNNNHDTCPGLSSNESDHVSLKHFNNLSLLPIFIHKVCIVNYFILPRIIVACLLFVL